MTTHDAELNLLKVVLSEKSFGDSLEQGIRGEHFRDALYGQAWEFIRDHHREYGVVPEQATLLREQPDLLDFLQRATPLEPAGFYADQVLETYTRRAAAERLMLALPKLEGDVSAALREVAAIASDLQVVRNRTVDHTLANTGPARLAAYHQETVYGAPFGWDTLDSASLGAHPGDLCIFAARPAQGKTMIMLYNALTAWRDDRRVLVIATEVPSLRLFQRLDAIYLRLDYDLFKKRMLPTEDVKRLEAHLENRDEAMERFHIVDGTGMTPSALGSLIERVGAEVVYVDSVHKLEPDGRYRERWHKMANLANELKDLVAQRYQVPVICNTHFNREVNSIGGKNTDGSLESVAGGDEWGKVSDLVVAISRGQEEVAQRALKLRIIKGRETEDGLSFHVRFDFKTMDFSETDLYHPPEDVEREAKADKPLW